METKDKGRRIFGAFLSTKQATKRGPEREDGTGMGEEQKSMGEHKIDYARVQGAHSEEIKTLHME